MAETNKFDTGGVDFLLIRTNKNNSMVKIIKWLYNDFLGSKAVLIYLFIVYLELSYFIIFFYKKFGILINFIYKI